MEKLAELLLKKETLSLPDIVDTLGDRPHGVKESIAEYLTELREREAEVDDTRAEEEKLADQKLKEAIDDTKFDPDAEVPDEEADEEEEKKDSSSETAKAATDDTDATPPAEDSEKSAKVDGASDEDSAASKAEGEETPKKKGDEEKKE